MVTICFDPFFKDVKSEKYQNFDSKSWAFSWIDGFQKDFNHSDMLGLWEKSNHKFEQIVKEIMVIKDEGKEGYMSHYLQLKYQVAKMRGHGSQWFYILKNK